MKRINGCRWIVGLTAALLFFSCGSKKKLPPQRPKQTVEISRPYPVPRHREMPNRQQTDRQQESQEFRIGGMAITGRDNQQLYRTAQGWLGTPHRMGGNSKKGVDCSGLVRQIYLQVYRKELRRSSAQILKDNCLKIDRSELREGDLVFFRTRGGNSKIPNHVGIYLKNGRFVHASTSRGVIISALSEPYYLRRWITGGRVK